VLRRCLAKDPADRYPTARAVAAALEAARDPSRRQQPMPTEVLTAATLPRPRPAPFVLRPLHAWLLVVPLAAAAVVYGPKRGAPTEAPPFAPPATSLAAAPPTTFAAAAPVVAATAPPVAAIATPRPGPPPTRPSPTARVTPSLAAPAAAALVPRSEAVAPPTTTPGPGWLQVVARPWGEVTVDGRVVGTTPFDRVTVPAGAHTVRVRHPSYPARDIAVTIRPGETERIRVDFSSPPP
jgi:serine/threonine-protein kinase